MTVIDNFYELLNGNLSISKVDKIYFKTLENKQKHILLNCMKLFDMRYSEIMVLRNPIQHDILCY